MYKKLVGFYRENFTHFFEAVFNLVIFLPYFFSVKTLLKTLFHPWKNISLKKTARGFLLSDIFDQLSYNLISRSIGFIMRFSMISFYIIMQAVLLIALPFIILIYFFSLPLFFIVFAFSGSPEQQRTKIEQRFMSEHLLNQENHESVRQWFEREYERQLFESQWWKLKNLFAIPPLARDWAVGYSPNLDQFAEDLTHPSYQSTIKHMVGRDQEIEQIERVLARAEEANVLIVGEEGVGKHTIVEGFAKKIYEGTANPQLVYKRILRLNFEKILTQYTDAKQREVFVEQLLQEAVDAKNIIILIDSFDKYIAGGENRVDLSIPIEKFAQSQFMQIIAITTPYNFQKYIAPQDKLAQVFTKVEVPEVSKKDAEKILLERFRQFEAQHNVILPYETIHTAIEKSDFYITTIPFPEKAMKLIENACIYTARAVRKKQVTPDAVDKVLSEQTHVPTQLSGNIKQILLSLESLLSQKVIDQQEALSELSSVLRRSFLLREKRKKPLASMLFLGPTGVGKTNTARAITEVFFGSSENMIRFDMSTYQTKGDIPNLIGSLELNIPGLLTTALREKPFGVLLLDEIEKAHPDLLNIFLTVLDEGYITDGFGKKVDCKNIIVIATSNAGSDIIYKFLNKNQEGSNTFVFSSESLINYLIERHTFTPEFLNRFDGVVLFKPLAGDSIKKIAIKKLEMIKKEMHDLYKVTVIVNEQTLNNLLTDYNPAYGARDMERILRSRVEDHIAKGILSGQVKQGEIINL